MAERPDWLSAAEVLVRGCAGLTPGEPRVRWLENLCLTLGDEMYPAFLRVLCLVGEHGEPAAQRAVAQTLAEAMGSARLPSGTQAAWGAVGGAAMRRQGPIEFLCAWYLHPSSSNTLVASGFNRAARSLLSLVGHDTHAHELYRNRLVAAADDPLEGTWTRSERDALRVLAREWRPDSAPAAAVDAFLQAARQGASTTRSAVPAWAANL